MAQPQDRAAAEPPEEERHADTVTVVEPDPDWPRLFQREAHRISAALGRSALRIEHVGSTAVPGLPAKPVIDVLLVVVEEIRSRIGAR